MNRFSRLTIAVSLSLALVGVPAMTLAATDVTYALKGVEYAATPSVGSFAGVTVAADDYGAWQATIVHESLDSSPTAITGGSFALDGHVRDLAGTITGGSITLLTTSSCGKQTYSISGSFAVSAGGSGTAAFTAVLTHYRVRIWGHCVTYAATVNGSVTFHLG